MKKIIILISLFLISGCYNYKELNDMAILSSIGIDKNGNNYLISAQIMNAKESKESQDSQIVVYEEKAKTIHEAIRKMTLKSPNKLYGEHLSKIVLSEEVAKEGIDEIIDVFNRITSVRDEFVITIVKKNKARDVLKVLTTSETVPAEYVKSAIKSSDINSGLTYATKLDEFISLYLKKGIDPVVPVLKIDKVSKKGRTIDNVTTTSPPSQIVLDGLAITHNGKFTGYLKQDEIVGYNYIRNQIQQMVIPVKCDNKNYASITILKNKTKNSIKKKNDIFIITINVNAKGVIAEYNCKKNLSSEKTIISLQKIVNKKIKNYIKSTVNRQKNEKSKYLGFERMIYLNYPNKKINNYKVNYNIDINLIRKGEIKKSIKGAKKDNEYQNWS